MGRAKGGRRGRWGKQRANQTKTSQNYCICFARNQPSPAPPTPLSYLHPPSVLFLLPTSTPQSVFSRFIPPPPHIADLSLEATVEKFLRKFRDCSGRPSCSGVDHYGCDFGHVLVREEGGCRRGPLGGPASSPESGYECHGGACRGSGRLCWLCGLRRTYRMYWSRADEIPPCTNDRNITDRPIEQRRKLVLEKHKILSSERDVGELWPSTSTKIAIITLSALCRLRIRLTSPTPPPPSPCNPDPTPR